MHLSKKQNHLRLDLFQNYLFDPLFLTNRSAFGKQTEMLAQNRFFQPKLILG